MGFLHINLEIFLMNFSLGNNRKSTKGMGRVGIGRYPIKIPEIGCGLVSVEN